MTLFFCFKITHNFYRILPYILDFTLYTYVRTFIIIIFNYFCNFAIYYWTMTKNCKFDQFCFFPFSTNSLAVPVDLHQSIPLMDVRTYSSTGKNHQHEVIIFLNGRVYICDVTELQARAIILFATRGMEERKNDKDSDLKLCNYLLQSQLYGSPSLSMKRSLQRFLQKRRQRSLASSPYSQ